MAKRLEISEPRFGVPRNTLAFSMLASDGPLEVCRFVLLDDDRLDVQIIEGVEMTDAARKFIEVVKDQIENMDAIDLIETEALGTA